MCQSTLLKPIKIVIYGILAALFLSSCGGGGPDSTSEESTQKSGKLSLKIKGITTPIQSISYSTPSEGNHTTDNNGSFNYKTGEQVSFTIAGRNYTALGQENISPKDLVSNHSDTANNLSLLLLNLDSDNNSSNGIRLDAQANNLDPSLSSQDFLRQLYKITGSTAKTLFSPSLGINLEAPQAEADSAGQAMPFVDIFRTARPFPELSNNDRVDPELITKVDEHGWPIDITPSGQFARTKLLQGMPRGGIPDGIYTLLYEGEGQVSAGGNVIKKTSRLPASLGTKGSLLTLELRQITSHTDTEANAINLVTNSTNIKNIRLIMPGGTCKDDTTEKYNHFIRVESDDDCPAGSTYISFASRLLANRNEIIFNPDYLSALSNFKVIRMMNFMESSPGISSCRGSDGILDTDCVLAKTPWSERATLDDAVWGGSGRTEMKDRKGVPVEVLVELANQLKADPWFNMPHYADDEYIEEFAEYVSTHLKFELKPYVEYSNETWNSGFIGFHYMQAKGLDIDGFDSVPSRYQNSVSRNGAYFARLRYYSRRSVEIFQMWESLFGNRLVRVVGTSQGDTVLSEEILQFENAPNNIDALAVAPYFFGCIDHRGSCSNAPKVLSEVTSVDDIFDVIDQPAVTDPSALDSTIVKIGRQANIAQREGVQLVSYEGGQHLTIMGSLGGFSEGKKQSFRDLFKTANRDPRMKQRYKKLLDGWKSYSNGNTTLFTLYTLPQTYYRFGNWGIKEHLGKTRNESPKFDAVMDFQEEQGECWWNDC